VFAACCARVHGGFVLRGVEGFAGRAEEAGTGLDLVLQRDFVKLGGAGRCLDVDVVELGG
jgi:hypothetical protein